LTYKNTFGDEGDGVMVGNAGRLTKSNRAQDRDENKVWEYHTKNLCEHK